MDDLSAVRPGYYRTPVNTCRWSWARLERDAREGREGEGWRARAEGATGRAVKLRLVQGMARIDTNVPADVDGPTRSSARR